MKVLLLAGEESGVLYAERIRAALPAGTEVRGYADCGFGTGDLAVMGFWAVLKRIFFFLRVKRTMEKLIAYWRPDVVCTVDYPGLNLALAHYAKRRGIRTVHVVCPQVWAWKKGRIPKIEASVDHLCCFFPFEPGYFKPGFAEFVGHPLVVNGVVASDASFESGTLAMLPGSRHDEIVRNLPAMLEAFRRLRARGGRFAALRACIPAANDAAFELITSMTDGQNAVEVTHGGARDLMRRAECAVVASGTATLEAALARCPTVLVYRVSALLAWFARRVIKEIRHVGLANIVAEKAGVEPPMPELLQEAFTAENVARQIGAWMGDPVLREKAAAALDRTKVLLKCDGDPIARIAEICGADTAA